MEEKDGATRILVVDDTIENIQVLGSILEQADYMLHIAQSGKQALEVLERVRPDLILLDIMMPEMDGFETCKRIKANPDTADIPVIFLTAKSEAEDVVKGFEMGVVDYVTKPFNAAELFVRVEAHVSRRRLQMEVEQRLREIERLKQEQDFFVNRELTNRIEPLVRSMEQLRTELGDATSPSLERVAEGVQGLADLVRTLKGLMSFGKGDYHVSKESVHLDQLVRRVIADLELAFGTLANILYQNELADPMVPADSDLLTGVFHGIVKRAVEEASTHTETADRAVRVRLLEAGGRILVKVSYKKTASELPEPKGGYTFLVAKAHGGSFEVETDDSNTESATFSLVRKGA